MPVREKNFADPPDIVNSASLVLTIRPTALLARRLRIPVPRTLPPVTNRVADWCAHEFQWGRNRFLFFCNTATVFPVVTHGAGVVDEASLIRRLIDSLRQNLRGTDHEFKFERWIVPELGSAQFAPIPGKTVLSSINELILAAKTCAEFDGCSPIELGSRLAETPMKVIGYSSPERAFANLTGPAVPA